MTLKIISAEERLARRPKINVLLFAPSGVGKTFQARTLDPDTTLLIDLESGTLSLNGEAALPDGTALPPWRGDVLDVRKEAATIGVHPWELARALACLLSGPDPSAAPGTPYARDQYEIYKTAIGDPVVLFAKYQTVFIDSITVASRHCFAWAKTRPEAFSEKTGKPDIRGAYGLLGQEIVTWLTQLQHIADKSVIAVGILDVIKDPDIPGRVSYSPQIEGGKAGREMAGIFDQILTLGLFSIDPNTKAATLDMEKGTERAFICRKNNPFGVPAKGRDGTLDMLEAPNLGALLAKVAAGVRRDTAVLTSPQGAAA